MWGQVSAVVQSVIARGVGLARRCSQPTEVVSKVLRLWATLRGEWWYKLAGCPQVIFYLWDKENTERPQV